MCIICCIIISGNNKTSGIAARPLYYICAAKETAGGCAVLPIYYMKGMKAMDVKIIPDRENKKLTAAIYGDIDHHTAKFYRSEIDSAIDQYQPHTLIIDFENVTFMDSSGIGLVMGRYKLMSQRSGEVLTANPPPYIRKVMILAGLNKLCRIVDIPSADCEQPKEPEQSISDSRQMGGMLK